MKVPTLKNDAIQRLVYQEVGNQIWAIRFYHLPGRLQVIQIILKTEQTGTMVTTDYLQKTILALANISHI